MTPRDCKRAQLDNSILLVPSPAHRRSQMDTVRSVLPLMTRGPVLSMPVIMAECALH